MYRTLFKTVLQNVEINQRKQDATCQTVHQSLSQEAQQTNNQGLCMFERLSGGHYRHPLVFSHYRNPYNNSHSPYS